MIYISDSQVAGWIQSYPELKTRPLLLQELRLNKPLRHILFHRLNVLESIVLLKDKAVKSYLFDITYTETMARLKELESSLNEKDIYIWAELIGVWRNIIYNMRAGILEKEVTPLKGNHNIYKHRPGNKLNWHWLTQNE